MSSKLPPEILSDIFSSLETDNNSLFSCCLVSREWCPPAIYWLWKRPFHICPLPNEKLLVKTCIKLLSNDVSNMDLIQDVQYDDTKLQQPPLFDYATFLQHLNYREIYEAAWHYLNYKNDDIDIYDEEKRLFMDQDIDDIDTKYYEFDGKNNNFNEYDEQDDSDWNHESSNMSHWLINSRILLITSMLCELFLSHSNNIISLNLCTSNMECDMEYENVIDIERINNILKLENVSSKLTNLKKFVCGGSYNLQLIIDTMINICHDIKILEVIFEDHKILNYSFSNLIKGQENLEEFKFIHMDKHDINRIFNDSLSNQAHSLRILCFESCTFNNSIPFKEMSLLRNLETLILINCRISNVQGRSLDFSFPSLKNLRIETNESFLKDVERLISHSNNLEEIVLFKRSICLSTILDIIAIHCSKIKVLDVCVGNHCIHHVIPIFIQCHLLESIRLELNVLGSEETIESLNILAKNIPRNLNNLSLIVDLNFKYFKEFFTQFDEVLKIYGFNTFDDIIREIDEIDEIDEYIERARHVQMKNSKDGKLCWIVLKETAPSFIW
ncbi:hypothetical protein C1645_802006 [Glomus cerebriforme]|uniref:F-box domain-containing protein n=1 Tax=Glomus cerebriforme TaxID=658196 RepID=A0A397TG80_9GLOM|nr:hypothetical protein C1645_802006 [Glomus cerebriforme]